MIQVFTALYSNLLFFNSAIIAVHAPQSPEAQPSLVPVNLLSILK